MSTAALRERKEYYKENIVYKIVRYEVVLEARVCSIVPIIIVGRPIQHNLSVSIISQHLYSCGAQRLIIPLSLSGKMFSELDYDFSVLRSAVGVLYPGKFTISLSLSSSCHHENSLIASFDKYCPPRIVNEETGIYMKLSLACLLKSI